MVSKGAVHYVSPILVQSVSTLQVLFQTHLKSKTPPSNVNENMTLLERQLPCETIHVWRKLFKSYINQAPLKFENHKNQSRSELMSDIVNEGKEKSVFCFF